MKIKLPHIFYGWWVVAACFTISLYIQGVIGFGFTALIQPLSTAYGWSYTQISFAASLRGLEVGMLAPFVGFLVDKWGPRRIILAGSIMAGVALVILSRITSLATFYLSFALIALGMSALSPTVTMTTTANWFHKKIGLATGIMHSGVGFSGLMLPVVVMLIDSAGLKNAMIILGVCSLGITIPLALVIRDKPEKYGWLPDGETVKTDNIAGNKVAVEDSGHEFTVKEALKTRSFWQLALAMVFQILMVNAVTTHMLPYLSSIGISRTTASLVASAVPLTSVLGRFGFGWSSDRIQQRWIMAFGYAMMGLGLLFFTLSAKSGISFLIPSILFFSVGFGGNATVRASVIRDYYGRKHFGAIHGLTMGPAVIGNLVGPPLAGWFYDTQGSYQNIWLILTVLTVIPLVLMLTMAKPQKAAYQS